MAVRNASLNQYVCIVGRKLTQGWMKNLIEP